MRVNSGFDLCAEREKQREREINGRASVSPACRLQFYLCGEEANNNKNFSKKNGRLSLSLRMSHSNISSSLDTKEKQKKKKNTKRRDHVATRGEKEKEK